MNKPLNEQLKEMRKKRGFNTMDFERLSDPINNETISRLERAQNFKTIELIDKYLKPLSAHLQVVEDHLPKYTEEQLQEILRTGEASNYLELNFLKDYLKAKTAAEKKKIIRHYTGWIATTE